jgi:hypothetical protein
MNPFMVKTQKSKNLRVVAEIGVKVARSQVNLVNKLSDKGSF